MGETKPANNGTDGNEKDKKAIEIDGKPLRFVIVGIINTIIDFGIMNILKLAGLSTITANTISTGIAMMCSFFLNKKYTFHGAGNNYVREVILFFIFTMVGIWGIQNGAIYLITKYLPHFGLGDQLFANVAKLLASVFSLTWNYLTYNRFVFK